MNFCANSFAKINLFLRVLSIENNGYHRLKSLITKIDLADNLEITPQNYNNNPQITINIAGEYCDINGFDNIIFKIFDYFCKKFAINQNLAVKLKKNIPIGAGLGGGSSNAALFMEFLNEKFLLKLSIEELQEISLNFGSDIANFFNHKANIVEGRGNIINPLILNESCNFANNLIELPILIINPNVNLSTKLVFAEFDKLIFAKKLAISSFDSWEEELINNFRKNFVYKFNFQQNIDNLFKIIAQIPNDLEMAAQNLCPEIALISNFLAKSGVKISKMSGSGSTFFAIFNFDEENLAQNILVNLKLEFPNFLIKKLKLIL